MTAVQETPENRTAAQLEAFASHMDFLRATYRRDRAAGREGLASVPAADPFAWDPFAELHFLERLMSGTCVLQSMRA